jgi:hypothetical protein
VCNLAGRDAEATTPAELCWLATRQYPRCHSLVLSTDRTAVTFVQPLDGRGTPQTLGLPGVALFSSDTLPDTPLYYEVTVQALPTTDPDPDGDGSGSGGGSGVAAARFFSHRFHAHTMEVCDRDTGWGCDGSSRTKCGHDQRSVAICGASCPTVLRCPGPPPSVAAAAPLPRTLLPRTL